MIKLLYQFQSIKCWIDSNSLLSWLGLGFVLVNLDPDDFFPVPACNTFIFLQPFSLHWRQLPLLHFIFPFKSKKCNYLRINGSILPRHLVGTNIDWIYKNNLFTCQPGFAFMVFFTYKSFLADTTFSTNIAFWAMAISGTPRLQKSMS